LKNFEDYTINELHSSVNAIKFIQEYFSVKFNRKIFPFYGTLLGIVRENNFIKKDNDIDMVWVSHGNNKKEILEDYNIVLNQCKKDGIFRSLGRTLTGQYRMELKEFNTIIDTYIAWGDKENNFWTTPYGCICNISDILPLKIGQLNNQTLLIPFNSEKIVSLLYKDWKTPKQYKTYQHIPKKDYLNEKN
jgi:hypothetical protein